MKRVFQKCLGILAVSMIFMALTTDQAMAQKKGGGGAANSRPANVQKPAASSVQKPAASNVQKPAAANVQKPAASNVQKPASKAAPSSAETAKSKAASKAPSDAGNRSIGNDNNVGNKTNVGNKVNVDNSKKNVNVNVDNSKHYNVNNSHNTTVRHTNNYRPYSRPPYRYGGYRYNCYHPYYYHPYRPFAWGPMWHPWGFFVATLAATAIIVSFAANDLPQYPVAAEFQNSTMGIYAAAAPSSLSGPNASWADYQSGLDEQALAGDEYYYDAGVFYLKGDGGYTVVAAPVGAIIPKLPDGYETIKLDDGTTNYYFGGAFYEKSAKGYTVVPPTAGAVVEHLPDGGEEVDMGGTKYVKFGEVYFQPIQQDGKDVYEIASVEEDK
jgi:hypothetical protein